MPGGDQTKNLKPGKRMGRPPKPKVDLKATKAIALQVLGMKAPPAHEIKCKCDICVEHRERVCNCETKKGQYLDPRCAIFAEHRICHCEICGWWEGLVARDKRLRLDTRKYLTDRRDGKPMQLIGSDKEQPVAINVHVRTIGH